MKDIRLQAHRGVSSEYPEDTIAAFRAAIEEGYKITIRESLDILDIVSLEEIFLKL